MGMSIGDFIYSRDVLMYIKLNTCHMVTALHDKRMALKSAPYDVIKRSQDYNITTLIDIPVCNSEQWGTLSQSV